MTPAALLDLALESLTIDDPAVAERAFAAAHGVAMAHQRPDARFADVARVFLRALAERLLGQSAISPTDDWLVRLHATGIVELVRRFHPTHLPDGIPPTGVLPYAAGPSTEPITKNDARRNEVGRTLGTDFENNTIGRLVDDRRNYDMTHAGYLALVAEILGTVWSLGWREERFGTVEESIRHEERYDRHERAGRIERYGKKYSWAGFYSAAGRLEVNGGLSDGDRLSELGADPSFPERVPTCPWTVPVWDTATEDSDLTWL